MRVLALLFVLFCASAQAQRFVYELKYSPDSSDLEQKREEQFLLIRNTDGSSIFQSLGTIKRDSVFSSIEKEANKGTLKSIDLRGVPRTNFTYKVIKTPDATTVSEIIDRDTFHYIEPHTFVWKIVENTEDILVNGKKTKLAETEFSGRKFKAWFSEELPISDGPYVFRNLPGLIVKLQDDEKHYTFELIEYKPLSDDTEIAISSKSKLISKGQFYEAKQNVQDNSLGRMKQSGFTLSAEQERSYRERIKKRNNPLELKP